MPIANYLKATGAFVATLVRRREPVSGTSANGHRILTDWDGKSPEEGLIRILQRRQQKHSQTARAALFGFSGPHSGEVFFLGGDQQTIGTCAANDIVLTPAEETSLPPLRLDLACGSPLLRSSGGKNFLLNGQPCEDAELFDYDELEIAGNRFVFIDLDHVREMEGRA